MVHRHPHPPPAEAPPSTDPATRTHADPSGQRRRPSLPKPLLTVWNWLTAAVGAVMGLLPHLLHHVGLVTGAALITGTTGNLLFGAAGLLLSTPMLRRLHRRFGTWKAPVSALVLFAGAFAVSAFVIGPAISGQEPVAPGDRPTRTPDPPAQGSPGPSLGPSPTPGPGDHGEHH